jgi:LacI family transcriptional regulator
MVDEIFRDNADLGGIFVTNASTHYVAEYLKEKVSDRKINLIGYDLIDKNVEYLKEGWIDFLISQKAETQGYEGIYSLYREVVLQQSCPRSILMPIDVVMKENLIYYV